MAQHVMGGDTFYLPANRRHWRDPGQRLVQIKAPGLREEQRNYRLDHLAVGSNLKSGPTIDLGTERY